MEFNREELLSKLIDAAPALAKTSTIPGNTHFWFDTKCLYATDGGLGVKLRFSTDLNCGLPGKVLIDLLKTSALKEVTLEATDTGMVLIMGKSETKLVSLPPEQLPWRFTADVEGGQFVLKLSEAFVNALRSVLFVKAAKPNRTVHHGVLVAPCKDGVELYTTDSKSIAQVLVPEKAPAKMPRFVMPWGFIDRLLDLVEPGAILHIHEDSLLVDTKEIMVCSKRLELEEAPDVPKLATSVLNKAGECITLPAGLKQVLERAEILAGSDDTAISLSVKGTTLNVSGKYPLGTLNESMTLKEKGPVVTAKHTAHLITRALGQAEQFSLTKDALVLYGGDDFSYMISPRS